MNLYRHCLGYARYMEHLTELTDALEKVPFEPAETYYEGLVAWNMTGYFD